MSARRHVAAAGLAALTWGASRLLAGSVTENVAPATGSLPLVIGIAWVALRLLVPLAVAGGAAAAWAAAAWATASPAATLALAAWVLSGLLAGQGLRAGWRGTLVLMAAATPLALAVFLAIGAAPPERMLEEAGRELVNAARSAAPAGDENAVARAEAAVGAAGKFIRQVWPALLALGLLLNAAVMTLVGRWVAMRAGATGERRAWPPAREWRIPFGVVWLLAVGIALVITRSPLTMRAGLNCAVLAAALCSVQGAAVAGGLLHGRVPGWGQGLLALLALLTMAPLVVTVAAVIGLMDQWVDFRRLAGGAERA